MIRPITGTPPARLRTARSGRSPDATPTHADSASVPARGTDCRRGGAGSRARPARAALARRRAGVPGRFTAVPRRRRCGGPRLEAGRGRMGVRVRGQLLDRAAADRLSGAARNGPDLGGARRCARPSLTSGSSPRLRPLVGPELADVPLRAGGRSPGLRSWRRDPGGVGAARAPATLRDEGSCAEAALRQKKRPQSSSARARSATNETLSGPVARPVNAETATAGYRASARPGRRARPARKGRRDRPARRASRVPRARRARRALRDRPDRRVPPGRPAPPDRRVPPGRPAPPALRGLLGLRPQPDTSRSWVPLRPRTAPVPRRRPRRVPQARSSSAAEAC
jgi:hypothetical protein